MRFIDPDAAALAPATLSDNDLMEAQRALSLAQRSLESVAALVAAEIARRSHRDLGYEGPAQRVGARTPERLVQVLSGASLPEARRLVRVGAIVETSAAAEPWLAPVLGLDVGAIDAVRAGLGAPTAALTPEVLTAAAEQLAAEGATLPVDTLARRARELRDELDLESVPLHEQEFLRFTPTITGMTSVSGLLRPESAAVVVGAVDTVTSPRRGGPRFVEEPDAEVPVDDRTIDQVMVDALVEIVAVATRAPSGKLFGQRKPSVRVLVTDRDLKSGQGVAFIEGQADAVSLATAERHLCSSGFTPLLFDRDGQGIDEGRDERFHTRRQRNLIAARDGGCIGFDCDRPPSWSEVHHIVPWSEGGTTTVEDGVLLCRFHHMLVHNKGWRITRTGAKYLFVPPRSVDPSQTPIPAARRSAALRRLLSA
ncbi:hypothetical protein BH11ACT5_BH11ACT5_14540 [soil metagenome]